MKLVLCLHTCQGDRSFRRRQIPVGRCPGREEGARTWGPTAAAMPEEEGWKENHRLLFLGM